MDCPLCGSELRKVEWPANVGGYDLLCACGHIEAKYYGQIPASHPEPVSTFSPILTIIDNDTAACPASCACADGISNAASGYLISAATA
jgi:hypothetical protein